MAVDEQRLRRSLHDRLEASLGADEAALLMEYLPPVGWSDIATKRDLDTAITELKSSLLMWLVPTMIGGMGLAVAISRL
jgi:hypothetical protein